MDTAPPTDTLATRAAELRAFRDTLPPPDPRRAQIDNFLRRLQGRPPTA